jgi:hypothetical protein
VTYLLSASEKSEREVTAVTMETTVSRKENRRRTELSFNLFLVCVLATCQFCHGYLLSDKCSLQKCYLCADQHFSKRGTKTGGGSFSPVLEMYNKKIWEEVICLLSLHKPTVNNLVAIVTMEHK